ncbi:glycoside hydrolase family 3 C-terminal domain-containing protein [Rathayibacter festucae]|uniref:glycoside hydrolase family 3 C-terminal domain-containing protein n=1 Tax=Rathayibacter festucae TaxID=110937 RepID=UPI002A6B6E1E|nr:glycoside hydrolase family 3 N-terminal domain-containing protein [Rathayibacter festucae]MDY0914565.1 glycoside hydrolase family 3 C-terminal domain-containing protein [Rathayibacter festucae]
MTDTTTHRAADLTLEERASLLSGAAFWTTKSPGGVPRVVLEDGPHGVRHQSGDQDHLGIAPSEPATCFPPAVALAQTWDPELVERVGAALGTESRSFGTDVLLGPGVNIKRDPRCGRNFEYFSEDPLISGVMGSAWVRGLQSAGAGASLKHFAANNQELDRMRASSDIDERPLREIYLRAFERVVREARPWTVMASYNRLNGVPATENHWLLTEVLRDEWGFDGIVVSDWGAVGDRVRALQAGTDLQMPGGDPSADAEVVDAVRTGELDEDVVTTSSRRMLDLAGRAQRAREDFPDARLDVDAHHALAREVAARAIVLLKNDADTLPLERTARLTVVGPFATEPRLQGGGSSRVVPTRIDVPVDELRALAPEAVIKTAAGYRHDGQDSAALRAEAAGSAAASDAAIVFLGLTAEDEAEGTDRQHIDVPQEQIELLRAVAAAQPRTIAVVVHGGVVRLHEVAALVPAVLDATILGQAGGGAVADVLLGVAEPSGRLAETVPLRLEDSPSFLTYPGDQLHVRYGEGLFVGYRGHDRLGHDVAFPFGFGLSYTTFRYESMDVRTTEEGLEVDVVITNTGARDGREVVQIYVSKSDGVQRAPRELRGFSSVQVPAGESAVVRIAVPRSDLAHWDLQHKGWVVEGGAWSVHAAASSRDLKLTSVVEIAGDELIAPLTEDSTLGELLRTPEGAQQLGSLFQQVQAERAGDASDALGIDANASGMRIPLGRIRSLSAGQHLPRPELTALLARVNAARAQKAEQH